MASISGHIIIMPLVINSLGDALTYAHTHTYTHTHTHMHAHTQTHTQTDIREQKQFYETKCTPGLKTPVNFFSQKGRLFKTIEEDWQSQ